MKKIKLTQGKFAIVDDEDYDELKKYNWYALRDHKNGKFYAGRTEYPLKKTIYLHQHILDGRYIDHINRDGLDNRKCNLRFCNGSENRCNSKIQKNSSSGLRGVSFYKPTKKWRVRITKNKKTFYVGYFKDKDEAGRAWDKKAKELFGNFAVLNFPEKNKSCD